MHKIELLAPAGSEDALFAAIAAGADAVYFGTNRFNARERATNISLERLPYLTKIAHAHNVRMYMTLNIVFYDNEFSDAVELVGTALKSGIDAVIVQDLGMISVLRQVFPKLEIHASTQMTTHNLAQCKLLAEMGVSQINLSRELSLGEIKPLAAFLHENSIVPEVFIHGAYCISFSGQCYFSGGLYGLPGNRGQCVQPCRREFCPDPISCDSSRTKEKNYLTPFNLKDNCAFGRIKELVEACGSSCSLKIEGRIKSADYVYAVTSAWREQLDKLESGAKTASADERLSLSMNRGFSNGYLENDISRDMFTSGKKDHSWTECGSVVSFRADIKTLLLALADSAQSSAFAAPGKGDEVAIYGKNGSFVCNASVKGVEKVGSKQISATIAINGKLNGKIMPGQSVLRIKHFLSDDALADLKKTLASGAADSRETSAETNGFHVNSADTADSGKTAVSVRVSGQQDGFLETVWCIRNTETKSGTPDKTTISAAHSPACAVTVRSETRLSAAQKRSLDAETVAEKFGRLGETSFYLAETDCTNLAEGVFLPLGELNEIRRKAVAELAAHAMTAAPKELSATSSAISVPLPVGKKANPKNFRTITLFHSPDEYSAHVAANTENSIFALEIPVLFRDGVRDEYISFLNTQPDVIPYFPAILFETDFTEAVQLLQELAEMRAGSDGTKTTLPIKPRTIQRGANTAQSDNSAHNSVVICENAGLLSAAYDAGFSVVPGFHLNITNSYSVAEYYSRFKCPAFIPSPELTAAQIEQITLPENTELWLLPEAKNFLMQSRQCLVGRASGCKKAATDRECLKNCKRTVSLVGRQGESIIAEKRPGFYSRLLKD